MNPKRQMQILMLKNSKLKRIRLRHQYMTEKLKWIRATHQQLKKNHNSFTD